MDNLTNKIVNCYKEYLTKLNIGNINATYGELKNAIDFVKSGIINQELWDFYNEELEYNDLSDFIIKGSDAPVVITVTEQIRLEPMTDITAQLGHMPIVRNENGELYVKVPIIEDID